MIVRYVSYCLLLLYYIFSLFILNIECPSGKYKADTSNQLECLSCPLNSWSHTNGSHFCSCLDGHFRINSTDFSTDCIRK